VEAHHRRLLGRSHVVEFMTGRLRRLRIDVVGDVPVRIAQEEFRNVGDVGLDQDLELPEATTNDVCPGVCPGVATEVTPGTTSLPQS